MSEPVPDFGIKWPPGTPLFSRHQVCAYRNAGLGSYYHRKEVISALWPHFHWHRWSERMLRSFCDSRWNTWIGPASCGKTQTAAAIAYSFWLEAPDITRVIVCSTTVDALRSRIWGQIARLNQQIPKWAGHCGRLLDANTRILWKQGDNINGIFGMAVEDGPVETVVNNLVGFKAERVFLVLDEMQGIREAIMDATINMSANPWFGMLGMGNPYNLSNPLSRESEPLSGWDSIDKNTDEAWPTHGGPTKGGKCNFFDGRKSPADDSPVEKKRLFYLINAEKREGMLKACRGNEGDPRYCANGIGFPPSKGLESTVLDDSIIVKFHCKDRAVWTDGFFRWSSLDPSFEGKDKKVLTFGRCGEVNDTLGKRWVIGIDEQLEVPVDAESDEPIHYQIANYTKAACQSRGLKADDFGLDSSGEGGGLQAIFIKTWGDVHGIEFGGKPSDMPIDVTGRLASDAYDKRTSELNFAVREFAQSNGIRGLPDAAAVQFCARKTVYNNGKWCVEPKVAPKGKEKGFKQRMGYSPDNSDSIAIGVEVCRRKGAMPAFDVASDSPSDRRQAFEANANEYSEDNYLMEPQFG